MFSSTRDPRWSYLQGWPAFSLALVWFFNAVVLATTYLWAHEFRERATNKQDVRSFNYLIFYAFFFPILSLIQPLLDLRLLRSNLLHPILALVSSSFFLTGWTAQLALWFHCEVAPRDFDSHEPSICPAAIPDWHFGAMKAYLGVLVAVGYAACLGLAATTVVRAKRRAGEEAVPFFEEEKEWDEEEEGVRWVEKA